MAGLVSPATLEQIRAASDIVDIIGAVIPLKRAGANLVGLCPFHKEKTPSFNVNPHKQIFHCFGCHKGGDVFSFVQEYESIGFAESLRRLAERARIPLEFESDPAGQQSRFLKETLLQIHDEIAQRWHQLLQTDAAGESARQYLARRGVSAEAVKLFRLGYAPDAWDDTVIWGKSKNYDAPILEKAGLVIRKEGESRVYDRFRGRLMFPICDEQGRTIGFSGRIISGDEKTAKYVNSPETPIFTKGKVFFGLDKSKRALLDRQFAIVCEGQLDLIACYMAGVQNIVAPQGTAFTGDHARILKRYVNEVVLCFDSDSAGQAAAVRVLDSLLNSGLAIRVATIPSPHDPDSFIKAFGGAAFEQLIGQAEGFFDFYLKQLCAANDQGSDKGQMTIARSMAEALHKTGSMVLLDKYAQKTALRLGVSPDSIRLEFKRHARAATRRNDSADQQADAPGQLVARPAPLELWFLKFIFLSEELAGWIADHLDLQWVQHPVVRKVVLLWLEARSQRKSDAVAGLVMDLEDPGARSLVTEAMAERRPIPNVDVQLKDLILRWRNQWLDQQIASRFRRAGDAETPDDQRLELLKEGEALRRKKAEPLAPLHPDDAREE